MQNSNGFLLINQSYGGSNNSKMASMELDMANHNASNYNYKAATALGDQWLLCYKRMLTDFYSIYAYMNSSEPPLLCVFERILLVWGGSVSI